MKAWAVFAVALLPVFAAAQEPGLSQDLQKSLELPAHRALLARMAEPQTQLAPFETDGCSGGMSQIWRMVAEIFPEFARTQGPLPPWEGCCVAHDRAYHDATGASDPETSFEARLDADATLRSCVAAPSPAHVADLVSRFNVPTDRVEKAFALIGESMFNAVRLGGGPCSGLSWRWGYGYPGCATGFSGN